MHCLYLPPSLRHFVPLRAASVAPGAHAALEYDLVAALRPRLVADVGAGSAASFTVFCQAASDHDVDGLLYAVDSWDDDGGKEPDDETGSVAIQQLLHGHFRGIAYLMKMRVAEALQHFAPESIDLLRLDPGRAGALLPDLLAAWLPLVAPGGVLLCRGATDPSFARHSEGLGLLLTGDMGVHRKRGGSDAVELLSFLSSPDPELRADLARYYEHAARHHALRVEIHERGGGLLRRKAG